MKKSSYSSCLYYNLIYRNSCRSPALFPKQVTGSLPPALRELSEAAKDEKDIPIPVNPYFDLSVPTYITKLQDTYFLVDCYHDEIIYSDSLDRELNEWEVMTDEINRGHTIASDGVVYLTDDTEK